MPERGIGDNGGPPLLDPDSPEVLSNPFYRAMVFNIGLLVVGGIILTVSPELRSEVKAIMSKWIDEYNPDMKAR